MSSIENGKLLRRIYLLEFFYSCSYVETGLEFFKLDESRIDELVDYYLNDKDDKNEKRWEYYRARRHYQNPVEDVSQERVTDSQDYCNMLVSKAIKLWGVMRDLNSSFRDLYSRLDGKLR